VSLPAREPDGQFNSFIEWCNKASSWIGGTNPLCADAKDRVCENGGHFMRARDEAAFPVRFWFGAGNKTQAQQSKAKRDHLAAMKLNYPWRFK